MENENGKKSNLKTLLIVTIIVIVVCNVISEHITKICNVFLGIYLIFVALYLFKKWKNNQEER